MQARTALLSSNASLLLMLTLVVNSSAEERTPAERGYDAIIGRAFAPAIWPSSAYENAWKRWGVAEKPEDYDQLFMERYGLHPAPYENKGLPMGLRKTRGLLGQSITNDCLVCHASSIAGQSVLGLGNASFDMQGLYEDLFATSGVPFRFPFQFSNVRGTVEAGALLAYLMQFRNENLNIMRQPMKLPYTDDHCEDIPAWWNLKKKKTMYHNGGVNARSVRSLMNFMLSPTNSAEYIKKQEPLFTDIQAWILSLEPPKYPFEIDSELAERGKAVFQQNCVRCHGTYGPDGQYPNKHVPLDQIGTDATLARGFSMEFLAHYADSWFAQETGPDGKPYVQIRPGYQAPPLDGVWATAPYFHNGSAPTVYHVLNSKARPTVFTRSYRTDADAYDAVRLGWKITELDSSPGSELEPRERRKIYDTSQPGRGNGGHTFGDRLNDDERAAVIEYLKTL